MPYVPPPPKRLRHQAGDRFLAGRKAETQYARQLRQVAHQIDDIVRSMTPGGVPDLSASAQVIDALNHYAATLYPWAQSAAWRMIQDVSKRDALAWAQHSRIIGRALKLEIDHAPTGDVMRRLLAEQASKITSIPQEAAQRLFHLTTEGMIGGTRASEIAKMIMASGEVSASRATMLAQTAVSSTATALTEARALYVGSPGYYWRTSKDSAVRPSHRRMEGKFVRWDSPPTLDGWTGHCGTPARCRCFPEPELDKI